ncbi:MAG: hypothetical protein KDA32_12210 [Phycisphaerales bacterium]|nr:hypothetical protein [Phycisphaerales bacterium]
MRTVFGIILAGLIVAPALADNPAAVAKELDRNFRKLKSIKAAIRTEQVIRGPAGVSTTTGGGQYEFLREDGKRKMRYERTENTQVSGGSLPPTVKSVLTICDGEYTVVQTTIRTLVIAKRMRKSDDLPELGGRRLLDRMLEENDVKMPDRGEDGDHDIPDEIEGKPVVTFEARPKRKGRVDHTIYVFFKDTGILARMESFDAEKQRMSLVTHTGVKTDEEIDPKRFVYTPAPTVNIIDETDGH